MFDSNYAREYTPEFERDPAANIAVLKNVQSLITVPAVVLDVGCGSGHLVRRLRGAGIAAWGMDVNPEIQAVIRPYALAGASAIPFPDDSFDLVIAKDVLEHLVEMELLQALEEMMRVSPVALVSMPTVTPRCSVEDILNIDPTHVLALSLDQWVERLSRVTDVSVFEIYGDSLDGAAFVLERRGEE